VEDFINKFKGNNAAIGFVEAAVGAINMPCMLRATSPCRTQDVCGSANLDLAEHFPEQAVDALISDDLTQTPLLHALK
jgi:hypothetical protein